ncbi:MAG: ABC transporter substrate-binding protein [Candidatus Pacebacteria bacterium]|nr:ABC transporter substrate-binding protein [Candidatus Paceibacterota bacterium]
MGVSQTASHLVFTQVIDGIREGFRREGYTEGKDIIIDIQNGQGDQNINQAIAQKFSSTKGDYNLFLTLGTGASQAMVNLIKDKPIIFAAVTDPVFAKLVQSNEMPGANVTGTTDVTDYRAQLNLFKRVVPTLKKIGILYNPGEINSISGLKNTEMIAKDLGLEVITTPINNTNDILNSAKSIANKVDGVFILPDNTLLAGQESIMRVMNENKKPVFAFDETGVKVGGLISIGTNYEKLGERSARMAVRVLKGDATATMPVEGAGQGEINLFINQKTADLLGIEIPEDILKQTKQIYK